MDKPPLAKYNRFVPTHEQLSNFGKKGALARWGSKTIYDRFRDKVDISDSKGCWVWTGCRLKRSNGSISYGTFKNEKGKAEAAHRVAYRLLVGNIPSGKEVCHSCDNPGCVRISHLFIGTHKENMIDASRKKRMRGPSIPYWKGKLGDFHPSMKYPEYFQKQIRNDFCRHKFTAKMLSVKYGISYYAVRGILYKHVHPT